MFIHNFCYVLTSKNIIGIFSARPNIIRPMCPWAVPAMASTLSKLMAASARTILDTALQYLFDVFTAASSNLGGSGFIKFHVIFISSIPPISFIGSHFIRSI